MKKAAGLNRHQKSARRVGERHVSKEQVAELLVMARSEDADERLEAVQFLCPCHVRTRIREVWETIYHLMEDPDPRVRRQAWHTIEDGGRPDEEEVITRLAALCRREADPKVRRFAEFTLDKTLGRLWREGDPLPLWLAARPTHRERGKCDFCGESGVFVERDLETMIPTDDLPRPALICDRCRQAD